MDTSKEIAVGIDIGGTNSRFGVVNSEGKVLEHDRFPTSTYPKAEGYVRAISRKIKEVLNRYEEYTFKGIGIGAPNGNYYRGTIEQAPNLPWKGMISFVDMFKRQFDKRIVLTNDANAAAIGEMMFGGARHMKDFIVITLGTGLGSGFVVNGDLVYGHDGFAGEMGHTFVYMDSGRKCGCGRQGCLETYASAQGIKRTVFELLAEKTRDSELRGLSFKEMTSEDIFHAAQNGDRLAKEAFDITGQYLGMKLADAVTFTSPEAIFLYGGLAKSGNLILNPTIKTFDDHVMAIYKGKVSILSSELNGKQGAILGAAALVWKQRK
ncbi:MAG TPA: ROK family protein [Bacteroidales bacterium]|nr:ROK family protein [Bacteroidales bacterium]